MAKVQHFSGISKRIPFEGFDFFDLFRVIRGSGSGSGDRYIGSLFRVDELVTDDSKRNSK